VSIFIRFLIDGISLNIPLYFLLAKLEKCLMLVTLVSGMKNLTNLDINKFDFSALFKSS